MPAVIRGRDSEEGVDGKDGSSRKLTRRYVKNRRCEWSDIAFYDRSAMLGSDIDAAIATGRKYWSKVTDKRADKKKTINLNAAW